MANKLEAEGKKMPPEKYKVSGFNSMLSKSYTGFSPTTPNDVISSTLEECQNLLLTLMQTVEGLLASCTTNVWNTYGGLSRVCLSVDKILCHGLIAHEGINDYWHFIQGLHWIKPELAVSTHLEVPANFSITSGTLDRRTKGKAWLKHCLENLTLSVCLEVLTECQMHLLSCYEKTAFVCLKQYQNALLICLKAVEQNQPSLLAELNPSVIYHQAKEEVHNSLLEKKSSRRTLARLKHCAVHRGTNRNTIRSVDASKDDVFLKNQHASEGGDTSIRLFKGSSSSCPVKSDRKCKVLGNKKHASFDENSLRKHSGNTDGCVSSSQYHHAIMSSGSSQVGSTASSLSFESWGTCSNLSDSFSSVASVVTLSPPENGILKYENTTASLPRNFLPLQRSKSDSVLSLNQNNCNKKGWDHSTSNIASRILLESPVKSVKPAGSRCSNISSPTMLCDISSALGTSASSLLQVDMAEEAVDAQSQFSQPTSSGIVDPSCSSPGASEIQIDKNGVAKEVCVQQLQIQQTPSTGKIKIQHVRSQSDVICGSKSFMFDSFNKETVSSSLSSSKEALKKRKSLIDGGSRVVASTECYFPKPEVGQSLTSFLSSKDFSDCAKLDRENAHFCISEALISAIEKIKCNQMLRKAEEEEDESDEEIQSLKQRIRIRRRERLEEKSRSKGITLLSDGFTDSTSTSQGASSPFSTAHSSSDHAESSDSEDVDELDLSDAGECQLASLKKNGLSLSMASLYSDADIARSSTTPSSSAQNTVDSDRSITVDNGSSSVSAETVALCLLKKFTEKQLPKASDLMWLVSEQDAPQRLLPLPNSWPVSPDQIEEEFSAEKTRLRGSLEWAPPRAQVIFNIHPTPQRAILIAKQNYRCAGCGMKVDRGYIKRFRYCEYLGKYFCHCCHNNHLAYIPARILHKWDFTKYYVSNFAKEVLDLLYTDPLFSIIDINNTLYRKVKNLNQMLDLRNQLYHLKEYIRTCRHSKRLKEELDKLPNYWINDVHLYSIQDLTQVRSSELPDFLCHLVMKAVHHVTRCPLCQAKGFFCEFCRSENTIFPFELRKVVQCHECGSCSHRTCFIPGKCPKCTRIKSRQRAREQKKDFTET